MGTDIPVNPKGIFSKVNIEVTISGFNRDGNGAYAKKRIYVGYQIFRVTVWKVRVKQTGYSKSFYPNADRKISVETENELQEIGRRLTEIEGENPGSRVMITSRESDGISVNLRYKYEGPIEKSFDTDALQSSEVREEKYH